MVRGDSLTIHLFPLSTCLESDGKRWFLNRIGLIAFKKKLTRDLKYKIKWKQIIEWNWEIKKQEKC